MAWKGSELKQLGNSSVDALQVFVRGFETPKASEKIIKELERMGFLVVTNFDGRYDSRGGIIETAIQPADELETEDFDEILKAVADTNDIFIQYRTYELLDEGERHL